jgi:hypothetical protein
MWHEPKEDAEREKVMSPSNCLARRCGASTLRMLRLSSVGCMALAEAQAGHLVSGNGNFKHGRYT